MRERLPQDLTSSALAVHEPFDQALSIEFFPLFDMTTVRQVFIDVEYDDPRNNFSRSERLDIRGDRTDNAKLRFALLDPDQG